MSVMLRVPDFRKRSDCMMVSRKTTKSKTSCPLHPAARSVWFMAGQRLETTFPKTKKYHIHKPLGNLKISYTENREASLLGRNISAVGATEC